MQRAALVNCEQPWSTRSPKHTIDQTRGVGSNLEREGGREGGEEEGWGRKKEGE